MNRLVKKIIAQGSWSVFTVTQLASLQLGSSNARAALVKRAIACAYSNSTWAVLPCAALSKNND